MNSATVLRLAYEKAKHDPNMHWAEAIEAVVKERPEVREYVDRLRLARDLSKFTD